MVSSIKSPVREKKNVLLSVFEVGVDQVRIPPLIITEPFALWLFKMKATEFTVLAHHAICPWSLKDGIFSNIPDWLKMLSYVTSDYLSQLVLCYIKDVTNINHM